MPVGEVGDAHRRVGGVDVLAAGAGRPVGVDAHIGLADLDLDRIVDDRIDPDAGEGGVAARIAVIGRDAHQAVDARLGLQPAIGIVALDQDGGGLDAGLFAVMDFQHLDLEAAALGPARVHAQQHRRPVLALGAAGAGMDFEIGVVGVGLARQHRLDLARLDLAGQRADRRFGLCDDATGRPLPRRARSGRYCLPAPASSSRTALTPSSRPWRSRISFWASCASFQRVGSSARMFR